jgi:hypothetical protein
MYYTGGNDFTDLAGGYSNLTLATPKGHPWDRGDLRKAARLGYLLKNGTVLLLAVPHNYFFIMRQCRRTPSAKVGILQRDL